MTSRRTHRSLGPLLAASLAALLCAPLTTLFATSSRSATAAKRPRVQLSAGPYGAPSGTLKLRYFDVRGVAETARMIFVVAGEEFEDARYSLSFGTPGDFSTIKREEFDADRAAGKMDVSMGKVPVLDGGSDFSLPQSKAIERYLAGKFGLMGSTPEEAAWVDAVCEHVRDINDAFRAKGLFGLKDEDKKAEIKKKWFGEEFPELIKKLETALPGEDGHAVAGKTSLADIVIFKLLKAMFGFSKGVSAEAGSRPLVKVPQESLFVSEPDPWMFGNKRNTPNGTGWNNSNWLESRFHFNFAEHQGGSNGFGVLRVMNDDLVQPQRGFGTHPHRDMEIITFVVDGSLTHKDSMGTEETLSRGSIQFMTAGTGVRHSEHNLDPERPLRFIQSWILPRSRGLPPNYGSMVGDEAAAAMRRNQWAHVVADVQAGGVAPVQINQDCNVYVAELDAGVPAPAIDIKSERQGYMLVVEGDVTIGGQGLRRHDAAMLSQQSLELQAGKDSALILLFEMAASG